VPGLPGQLERCTDFRQQQLSGSGGDDEKRNEASAGLVVHRFHSGLRRRRIGCTGSRGGSRAGAATRALALTVSRAAHSSTWPRADASADSCTGARSSAGPDASARSRASATAR
jgi:hypothetical protein